MKLKKLLASLLCVAIVLSTMSFTVFAAERKTVSTEADLKAALEVGGSVVLGGNILVEEKIEVPAGVTVELDLAGFAITSGYQQDSTTKHVYPFSNSGVLTITDSSEGKTGSITGRGIYNQDGGVLTLTGVKVVSEDWNGGACVWAYGTAKTYINNCTMIGNTGVVSSEGYLEINGGTYTCYSGVDDEGNYSSPTYNIRAYNGLKITDGTFTSRHGVISLGGGEGIIENGTFTIESVAKITSNVVYTYGTADLTIENGSFTFANDKADSGAAVLVDGSVAALKINDGTFVGLNGMVSVNDNTVINGGSFDTIWDYNHYGSLESAVSIGATVTIGETAMIKTENGLEETILPVAKVGEIGYASLADALAAAGTMTGDVTVEIYDKVTLNQGIAGSYDSIKFVGKAEAAEIYLEVQGYITATGKTVAFEDLKLSKSAGGFITNAGFMNVAFGVYDVPSVSYKNCTFLNGAYASSGENNFTGCTFYRSHDKYGLWAYGNVGCTVDGCTFADYRGIKMYAEGAAKTTDLTVKNTSFAAVTDKPAIVLTYGESVTLENNTYSSTGVFELDLDGAPNGTPVTSDVYVTCKNDNGACGVLVDGKIYTTVAQAADVATEGSTVTLLHDSTETVEFAEGVILDKNNYTADGVTVKEAAPVAKIGDTTYTTLTEAAAAAQAGDEIVVLADVTEDVTVPAGVIFNGNGKQVCAITAAGEITFKGHTKATSFGTQYTNTTINIGVGACLEITGTGRLVIGHGCTFNIEGNIANAKTANVADLTPSLIMPGASFTGAGVTFNVKNAYIKTTASYCSSSKSASGTFDFNIENSIWEQFGKFAMEAQSENATCDFNLIDSVMTTTSHLVFGLTGGNVVIDNSVVNEGVYRQLENRGNMTIKNGSVVYGAVATSSNAKNPGTTIVDNATYKTTGEFSGSDLGTGTLIVKNGAKFSTGKITKANITIDAEGLTAGEVDMIDADLSGLAGEISVINNTLGAKIENGKIVLIEKPVAKIGDVEYTTIADAIAAAQDGDIIKLLADATIDVTTNIKTSIKIDGDGKKITQSDVFASNAANAVFDIMNGATVTFNNVTFDGIKNVAVMRTVSANVVIDNCVVSNCTQTVDQGLLRLALGNAKITNSQFVNNNCAMVISFGYDAANETDILTMDGCLFEGNTCNGPAVVYFADGDKGTITNTKFIDNTVTSAGNAATLYMGWGDGFEVSGCLFDSNDVTTTHATTKRFASAIFADGCKIENNIFLENSATRNGEEIATTVAVAAYYGEASVSSNYWNGGTPSYTVEYDRNEVEAIDYYTSYNAETGTLADKKEMIAKVGNINYATLESAFAAAKNGDTITLLDDIAVDSETYTIADGTSVTLDMNGKKITVTDSKNGTNSSANYDLFYIYGEMTVTGNGTIELTSLYDRDWNAMSAIFHNRGGVLTIKNGTYKNLGGTDMAWVVDNSGNYHGDATTNIEDGTLESTYTAIRNRMEQNSHGASGTAILNISGGTISGTTSAVWAQAASTSETSPATGEINVTGGNVGIINTARSTGAVCMTTVSGGTVSAFKGEVGELTVTGGTIGNVTMMNAAGETVDFIITEDGLYIEAPAVLVVAKIGDATYTSLQAAVDAAQDGDTITVLENIDLDGTTVTIPAGVDAILDLNGKTISDVCNVGQGHMIMVTYGANLTIKDSSTEKEGKITYASGTSNVGWTIDVEGNLVLESGTIELTGSWSIGYAVDVRPNAWGTAYTEPTTFVMNDGNIVSSDGAVRVASSSSDTYPDVAASFTMNDGKIDAAWDGIFVQQSNAAWDTLSLTINGGTIESDLNPVRFYGPAATSYVNSEDCVDIKLNGGTLTYTGTEEQTWMVEGILRIGGGVTAEDFMKDTTVTASASFAQSNVAEGYKWVESNGVYTLEKAEETANPFKDAPLFLAGLPDEEVDGVTYHPVYMATSIDSLNYRKVGFDYIFQIFDPETGETTFTAPYTTETNEVYSSISDANTTYTVERIGGNGEYLFMNKLLFDKEYYHNNNTKITITPYAIDMNGNKITGWTIDMTNEYYKELQEQAGATTIVDMFKEVN